MPWPPPTHIVSRPKVLSVSRRPLSRVHRMRAPVMPNGWPSAIAPPCGLSLSLNGARPRPIVFGELLTVGQRDGDDLAVEEAVVTRLDRCGLALDRVAILLCAADLLSGGDVLRGLTHRDVDVGIFLRVAGHELRVVRVRGVRIAAAVARNAFDAD